MKKKYIPNYGSVILSMLLVIFGLSETRASAFALDLWAERPVSEAYAGTRVYVLTDPEAWLDVDFVKKGGYLLATEPKTTLRTAGEEKVLMWTNDTDYGTLLEEGDAIVTCAVTAAADAVVALFEVKDPQLTTNSYDLVGGNYPIWNRPEELHPASWSFTNLGSVFGTEVDADRNIYVTATSTQAPTLRVTGTNGTGLTTINYQSNFGTLGLNGQPLTAATATQASGTIYKLDALTGTPTVFAQLPQQQLTINYNAGFSTVTFNLTSGSRTLGPGLGNIAFDDWHQQFFVTNFEDGKIYRIRADGTVEANPFDFGTPDNGAAGMPALGDRVWGVAVYKGRVYYSVWTDVACPNGNCGNPLDATAYQFTTNTPPAIRSVALDPVSGDFLPATDQLEWTGSDFTWNSPIADIDFNAEGQMVVAQKSILRDFSGYNHRSEVAVLTGGNGSWTADVFKTGPAETPTNSNRYGTEAYGGADFGYNGVTPDASVWYSSADMVRDNNTTNGSQGPHGFAGTLLNSLSGTDFPDPRAIVPYDPNVVSPLSIDAKGSGGELDIVNDYMSLGNLVWEDVNDDGLFNNGEPGIPNVRVRLIAENGITVIDSTLTNANGNYLFDKLFAGDYLVEIVPPAGYTTSTGSGFAAATGTSEPAPDPDTDAANNDDNGSMVGAVIRSEIISLRETTEPTNDAPLNDGTALLTDLTQDNNANYSLDFGLKRSACNIVAIAANVTCAGNEAISFDLTPTGAGVSTSYTVSVSGGAATSISPAGGNFDELTTFTLNDGAAGGGDFTVTLTDVDDNGCTLDVIVTDPGIPELTITALASCADENGTQVAPNTYYVEVSGVTGGNGGPYDVTLDGVTLSSDGTTSIFFGPFNHSGAGGAVQVVTATDNGAGASSCEATGSYEVPEILCGINDGGQASGCFCAGPTTDPAIPTSFILAQSQPGTFQAGGNTGQVQQYVLVNQAGNIVAVNLTGLFEIDTPGDYTPYALNYQLDESATLAPFLAIGQPIQPILDGVAGNGPLADACFAACNVDATVTYTSCSCYSVGSTIFADLDNDGNYDPAAGEFGIENVSIELVDAGGIVVATTMTDANGDYYFGGLDPGDYSLNIPTPATLYPISSTPTDDMDNGEDNDDNGTQSMSGDPVTSPTFTLGGVDPEPSGGQETGSGGTQDDGDDLLGDMTQDFGFFAPVTVGDVAFFDLNNDGLQTMGEPGVPGVTVTLLDENGNIVTMDLLGNDLTNVMTGADGSYLFDNLPPGVYSVQFDFSTIANPEFYTFTTPNAGGNDANDSDNSMVINPTTAQSDPTDFLLAGEQDLTLDVGLVCVVEVVVANPFTICSSQPINLLADASITPSTLGGMWTTSGDGSFLGPLGTELSGDPFFRFGEVTTYIPGPGDIQNGEVTLTLTTFNPAGVCDAESASVTIQILRVDCGQFMWDGQ